MNYDLTTKAFEFTPNQFIAGVDVPVQTAVKPASAALKEHAPVILNASGKLEPVTNGGSAVSTTGLYGITVGPAAAADDEVVVYLTGEFFADGLQLESDVTVADVEVPLRNLGIFLKD